MLNFSERTKWTFQEEMQTVSRPVETWETGTWRMSTQGQRTGSL